MFEKFRNRRQETFKWERKIIRVYLQLSDKTYRTDKFHFI